MKRNRNLVDVNRVSSEHLMYLARCAEGREYMDMMDARAKDLKKKFKGQEILVLRHLNRGAQEIALRTANVPYHHDVIYGNGEGLFYVLRENKETKHTYMVMVKLNFKTDEVIYSIASENYKEDFKDLVTFINSLSNENREYKWTDVHNDEYIIKCKIVWGDRECAIDRIANDNQEIYEIGQRCFRGCHYMSR